MPQYVAVAADQVYVVADRPRQRRFLPDGGRFVSMTKIHGGGAGAGGKLRDDCRRVTLADHQFAASTPDMTVETRETVMQPPATGAAGIHLVRHIYGHNRPARDHRSGKRRIVDQAQIAPEPEQDGRHRQGLVLAPSIIAGADITTCNRM